MGLRPRSRSPKSPAALIFPPPVLKKRYALEHEIGHGGSGRVYRAWDVQQSMPVALKRAHPGQKWADYLCDEARMLSCLHHPGIPTFGAFFEEEGRSYLVEEWRTGTPMSQLRFFSLANVLWIGRWCGDLLSYLHQQDLIYRDLTPNNLLVGADTLSLVDFGFARRRTDPPLAGGSPGYAAPEQWFDGVISVAADVYSLGMLLGCALTNCLPEEVLCVRSFAGLWNDPTTIPGALLPLLTLLDRMIASRPNMRPDLATVQYTLAQLAGQQV